MEDDHESDNIWIAVSNGNIERVKYLVLNEGVSVNVQDDQGYSPMHAAASYGEVAVLDFLVSLGGDVNLRDNDGDTPLLVCEHPTVLELLEQYGADIHARNREGEGIVEKAIDDSNEELFNYLVERGLVTDSDLINRVRETFEMERKNDVPEGVDIEQFLQSIQEHQGDDEEEEEEEEEEMKM